MSGDLTRGLALTNTAPATLRARQRQGVRLIEDAAVLGAALVEHQGLTELELAVGALLQLKEELGAVLRLCGNDAYRAALGAEELFELMGGTLMGELEDGERMLLEMMLDSGDLGMVAGAALGLEGEAALAAATLAVARTVWDGEDGSESLLPSLFSAVAWTVQQDEEDEEDEGEDPVEREAAEALREWRRHRSSGERLHEGLLTVAGALHECGGAGLRAGAVVRRLTLEASEDDDDQTLAAFEAEAWLRSEHARGVDPQDAEGKRTVALYRSGAEAIALLRSALVTPMEAGGKVRSAVERTG